MLSVRTPDHLGGTGLSGRRTAWLVAAVVLLGLLAACSTQALEPTPIPGGTTPQPTASQVEESTPTPQPDTNPSQLRIWVPPQFDPSGSSTAAVLMQEWLEEFSLNHPGIRVEVRVKTLSGPGNLLESLAAARAVAPAALPDLVALSRTDLESAAIKGLLFPFPNQVDQVNSEDWYDYAHELSRINNTLFGVPFAGDTLVLLYRPAAFEQPPTDWDALKSSPRPMLFAANSPQAYVTLALYLAAGGEVEDALGRPAVNAQALLNVYDFYSSGRQTGLFLGSVNSYTSESQVLDAYRANQADLAVTWLSQALGANLPDSAIAALPTPGGAPLALVTGWVWALTTTDPARQALAAELAYHLADSGFLGEWSQAAGYFPSRTASGEAWAESPYQPLLSRTALTARMVPTLQVLNTLGPAFQKGAASVISLRSTAQDAAAQVANQFPSLP